MSDSYQTLVDVEVAEEHAAAEIDRLRALMTERSIIEATSSDCVLGGIGHRPGRHYESACTSPDKVLGQLITNGVQFEAGSITAADMTTDEPTLTTGHVALTFWNWPPLSPKFIDELSAITGHEFVLARGKL